MFQNDKQVNLFLQDGITQTSILVIGDVMLDRYYFGEVNRISPEAPVPITRVTNEQETLGGAANVAKNLALLGCKIQLVGITGDDQNYRHLQQAISSLGFTAGGLVKTSRPTTTKVRVIGGHQQIVRLDFEELGPIGKKIENQIKDRITLAIEQGVDCVIISDYGKGVCTPAICRYTIQQCAERQIPVVVDPKGMDWRKYNSVPYITPNLKELGEAVKARAINDDGYVRKLAEKVRKRFNIQNVVVTRSEKGLSLLNDTLDVHIPTHAQEVFDVSGAGDTVIAVFGAALAGRMDIIDAAHLANVAAGFVVGKLGTYAISRNELRAVVNNYC